MSYPSLRSFPRPWGPPCLLGPQTPRGGCKGFWSSLGGAPTHTSSWGVGPRRRRPPPTGRPGGRCLCPEEAGTDTSHDAPERQLISPTLAWTFSRWELLFQRNVAIKSSSDSMFFLNIISWRLTEHGPCRWLWRGPVGPSVLRSESRRSLPPLSCLLWATPEKKKKKKSSVKSSTYIHANVQLYRWHSFQIK